MNLAALKPIETAIELLEEVNNQTILHTSAKHLKTVVRYLKLNQKLKYEQLMDITAVDYPSSEKRFVVVYQLLSLSTNKRIRLKVATSALDPLPTITDVYSTAG